MTISYTLDQLVDIENIKALKYRYGAIVDSLAIDNTPERLAQIFTPEATVDFISLTGKFMHDRADVIDYFRSSIAAPQAWMWHGFYNPMITLNGDTATCIWLLYAMSTPKAAPQARPDISYGRYHDTYVRTPEGWRQTKLVFRNETTAGTNG